MAKKNLDNLTNTIYAHLAGRLGGPTGLSNEIQSRLFNTAINETGNWMARTEPYIQLGRMVSEILDSAGVRVSKIIVMGSASAIAKCWAKYFDNYAELCEKMYVGRLRELNIPEYVLSEIIEEARRLGISIRKNYHLA